MRDEGRRGHVLLVVLIVLTVLSLHWTVQDFWDARPDGARYLLAARSLADGHGYGVMGEPFRLRPPGFSALLAPLVALRGYDFAALNLLVSLCGVLAVVLFYRLLLPRVGALVAFAAALLVWTNPQVQALCNQVLSDVPALACALVVLLVLRWADARRSVGRDLVLALALIVAVYVRSANLLLLPAILLHRACRYLFDAGVREPLARFLALRVLLPVAAFLVLYLPWILTPSFSSQYDSPDLHSYSTAFLRRDPNNPDAPALDAAQWSMRLEKNAAAYAAIFTSGMTTRRMSPAAPYVATLAVLALLSTLLRRREAPEWFALGTVVVLIGYYVAATRLLLPAFVIAVGALADSALWIGSRALPSHRRAVEACVAACLLVVALWAAGSSAQQADARERHASLLAVAEHVRATVPPDVAIGGDVGAVYALLLDRPVYSLRPLSRRGKRQELFRVVEERKLAVLIARRDGPLDPVVARLEASGNEVVTLPHHVVVHLMPHGS